MTFAALARVRPDWMLKAACRGSDPSLWIIERGDSAVEAKSICATCPVIDECLNYALANNERLGVWGGTCERERRRIRSRMRKEAAA